MLSTSTIHPIISIFSLHIAGSWFLAVSKPSAAWHRTPSLIAPTVISSAEAISAMPRTIFVLLIVL